MNLRFMVDACCLNEVMRMWVDSAAPPERLTVVRLTVLVLGLTIFLPPPPT